MKCPHCGYENPDWLKFCEQCDQPLDLSPRIKKEKKEAAPQSFYSHMPGWHIQDGWELWKDENGSWHRALIGQKED
jgi:hypothetical protein